MPVPMTPNTYQNGGLTIHEDGRIEIIVTADGYPMCEGPVPAPWMSEIERAKVVQQQREAIWMRGMFITAEQRVRNEAFDKRNERTTTKIKYRMCKNADEAKFVVSKVKEILSRTTPAESNPCPKIDSPMPPASSTTRKPIGK